MIDFSVHVHTRIRNQSMTVVGMVAHDLTLFSSSKMSTGFLLYDVICIPYKKTLDWVILWMGECSEFNANDGVQYDGDYKRTAYQAVRCQFKGY